MEPDVSEILKELRHARSRLEHATVDLECIIAEQRETNHLLRCLINLQSDQDAQYKLAVEFKGEHMATTAPIPPTDNTAVGQITVGFPSETVTNPNTGVTGAYAFNPASIQWQLLDATIASSSVDATTGAATLTGLVAGMTTGAATDTDTQATAAYTLVVAAATEPNTFVLSVAFGPPAQ